MNSKSQHKSSAFEKFALKVSKVAGSTPAFIGALFLVKNKQTRGIQRFVEQ